MDEDIHAMFEPTKENNRRVGVPAIKIKAMLEGDTDRREMKEFMDFVKIKLILLEEKIEEIQLMAMF